MKRIGVEAAREIASEDLSEPVDHLLDEVVESGSDVLLVDGVKSGSFAVDYPEKCVIVRGDLEVDDRIDDWEQAVLLVTGDVVCRAARFRGAFACEGHFRAAEYVYANSSNDYGFSAGELTAKLYVETGTATGLGAAEAELWSFINQIVVAGERVGRTPRERMTRAALEALDLAPDSIEELVELLGID